MQSSKFCLFILVAVFVSLTLTAQKGGGGHGGHSRTGGHASASHGWGVNTNSSICLIASQLEGVMYHFDTIVLKNGNIIADSAVFSAIVKPLKHKSAAELGVLLKNHAGLTNSFISFQDIEILKVSDFDPTLRLRNDIEFSKIDTSADIWRKIGAGKANVYDNLLFSNETPAKFGSMFKIVTQSKIYTIDRYNHFRSLRAQFRHFINNRYHEHFNKHYFPSIVDMIEYISKTG